MGRRSEISFKNHRVLPLLTTSPWLLLLLLLCGHSTAKLFPINPHIPLEGSPPPSPFPWPLPASISPTETLLTFNPKLLEISVLDSEIEECETFQEAVMNRVKDQLFFLGMDVQSAPDIPPVNKLTFTMAQPAGGSWCSRWPYFDETRIAESYEITVGPEACTNDCEITVKAPSVWGSLYAINTLSQLIWVNDGYYVVNATVVQDSPRFPHRGLLLDTARHFFHLEDFFGVLDGMYWNKLNVFHWHLTDDQSFPYKSLLFPELSEKGAYEPDLVYTQDDIQEVLEYARLRGIRVIPEFDTPGHTYSFGRAMPELLTPCYGNGVTPGTPNYPIHADYEVMNPMSNFTYDFLHEFFNEISFVFPDEYVHLGMDEVRYGCWNSSPEISQFMIDHGMTSYDEVEQYFVTRHLETVSSIGSRHIVWQDPLEKGVQFSSDTIVQVWKWRWPDEDWGSWEDYMALSTSNGYRTILSSCWYLNKIAYGEEWVDYYNCNPQAFEGTNEQKALVIGGEGALWAEYVDSSNLHSRLWPRTSALAERLWSPASVTDVATARYRLDEHRCRMVERRIPAPPVFNGYCPKTSLASRER